MSLRGRVFRRSVSKQLEAPLDKITIERVRRYLVSIGEGSDSELVERLRARIAELDEEVDGLQETNTELREQVARLEENVTELADALDEYQEKFPNKRILIDSVECGTVGVPTKLFTKSTGAAVSVNNGWMVYYEYDSVGEVTTFWAIRQSGTTSYTLPTSVYYATFEGEGLNLGCRLYSGNSYVMLLVDKSGTDSVEACVAVPEEYFVVDMPEEPEPTPP